MKNIFKTAFLAYFAIQVAVKCDDNNAGLRACTTSSVGGLIPSELTVDCRKRLHASDAELLLQQLDSLLSRNLTYSRVKSLSIVNSPLKHVPRSVCRLTTLTRLNLTNNRLAELPKDCLDNLTKLTALSAANNNITELCDGVLDRLTELSSLELYGNRINSIGLQVFADRSRLARLRYVDLHENELVSLEPWPYYLGLIGSKGSPVFVLLGQNRISKFTNRMRANFTCGGPTSHLHLDISYNRIRHVTDMTKGWNIISWSTVMCLLHFEHGQPSVKMIITGRSFACDCVDFDLIMLAPTFPYSNEFAQSHCNSSDPDIGFQRINNIPLERFVCELRQRCPPPPCRCVYRPWNATLHVYCSNSNLTALPLKLPQLPKSYTKYKLDFSNNPLRSLEHRDYFDSTSVLAVSNCSIESISMDVWKALVRIPRVHVDGNRLATVSSSVAGVQITTDELHLSRNPWRCSCDAKWMSGWLRSINNSLTNTKDILCSSPSRLRGMNIQQISEDAFCVNPVTRAVAISVSAVVGAALTLLSGFAIVYRLRFQLYARFEFHPFDRDECDGEDMEHDVFLCYSLVDDEAEGKEIVKRLEERNFKVSTENKWTLGSYTPSSIIESVSRSKRTVCLVNANFMRSNDQTNGHCTAELAAALYHWQANSKFKRLIILMASNFFDDADEWHDPIVDDLRGYRHQYTHVDWTADDWHDKLLYALPLHGMNNRRVVLPEHDDVPLLNIA